MQHKHSHDLEFFADCRERDALASSDAWMRVLVMASLIASVVAFLFA